MKNNLNPHWTEKMETGQIRDPLQVDTFRNRILTELLWGIDIIGIYQRLRYISFSLWCLDNLQNPEDHVVEFFEKIFLLANIAHNHSGPKDRGGLGISGEENVPWKKEDFHSSSDSYFSISKDNFRIQKGDESGFSNYYKPIMWKLFLIDENKNPTSLGKSISEEFDHNVDVEFRELQEAVEKKKVSRDLVLRFTDACVCLLDGREEELLRNAYFRLVSYDGGNSKWSWIKPKETRSLHLETKSSSNLTDFLNENVLINIDEFLKRYYQGNLGPKLRESLLLFLWIAKQGDNHFEPISKIEELKDIRELWRLYRYYDYFNIGCKALLSAVLQSLKKKSQPIFPKKLLNEIVSNHIYSETIAALLNGIKVDHTDKNPNMLKVAYQYFYYGEPIGNETTLQLETAETEFENDWSKLLKTIESITDPEQFDKNARVTEWAVNRLIEEEINSSHDPPLKSSSKIFAYVTVLFALLKLRYEHKFSQNNYAEYWNWLKSKEKEPPGPISLIRSLEPNQDLESFIQSVSRRWVVDQHNIAMYEKMESTRVPRLFSKNFIGKIEYQETSWTPSHSELKFERLIDVLFDLGLVENPNKSSFSVTRKGRNWLDKFLEES